MNMIAYDREESTEMEPRYYVYDDEHVVIYKGTYTQCLIVIGGLSLKTNETIEDIRNKTGGLI